MASGRTWAIKGVSDRTRDAVLEAAQAAGLPVGAWVDQALAQAAAEARHPRPSAATREDVAEVVGGLLDERLAPLVEKVDRATGAAVGNGPSAVEVVRARLRQRRAL